MQNASIRSSLTLLPSPPLSLRRALPSFVFDQTKRGISINSGINRGLRASREPGSLHIRQRRPRERDARPILRSNESAKINQKRSEDIQSVHDSGARDLWRGGASTDNDFMLKEGNTRVRQSVERSSQHNQDGNQPKSVVRRATHDLEKEEPDLPLSGVPYTTAASKFIFGRRSVIAALQARRRKLYNFYWVGFNDDKFKVQDICSLAEDRGLVPTWKSRLAIDQIKASIEVPRGAEPIRDDGVCLEVSPLPQPPIVSLGEHSREKFNVQLAYQSQEEAEVNGTKTLFEYVGNWRAPCLLWLHGVVDAGNVGAILRSAFYFGIDGIILTSRATASITDGALKSSSGAAEFIPIFKVHNPDRFVEQSKENGWSFYAAVAPQWVDGYRGQGRARSRPLLLDQMRDSPVVNRPSVIVLGNEEQGLPFGLIRRLDYPISVGGRSDAAMEAGVDSLNVGVAAAILCEKFLTRPSHSNDSQQPSNSRGTRRIVTSQDMPRRHHV